MSRLSQAVLSQFGLVEETTQIIPFGSGLINHTWKVITPEKDYILQRVNHAVFKDPSAIAYNTKRIANYLKEKHPEYLFVAPVSTKNRNEMEYLDEGYFRMFPFVAGSHSKDVVETPEQAYQAATQFGRFTQLLNGIDISQLKTTIPGFHDLDLRYQQFLTALKNGNSHRIKEAKTLIDFTISNADITSTYKQITTDPAFKQRVTHHDTKISNVLFDAQDHGICVIDLDTVMPGYFISDVGDMMRTYLSPVSEEEKDVDKIEVRDDFYQAIVKGYCEEMKDELTGKEKQHFFYSGKFMIYMQAIRFLTDYLNNDAYYGAKYPEHNLVRARNQMVLLQRLMEKEKTLATYI